MTLLVACGGGGGGTQSPTSTPVSLTNVQVPTLADEVYENGDPNSSTLPAFTVTADLAGDVGRLAGKTLYLLVEDPDGFIDHASLSQPLSATRNTLLIQPKVFGPGRGHYAGRFRLSVCYDAACASPMAGSPVSVPYDLQVLPGLVLNGNAPIVVSTRAGATTSVGFGVSLPQGLLYNDASLPAPIGGKPQIEVRALSASTLTAQVTATDPPTGSISGVAPTNVASEYLVVNAQAQTPKGKVQRLTAQVQVLYKTLP